MSKVKEDSQLLDEYRSIIRSTSAAARLPIVEFLRNTFEPLCTKGNLTFDGFEVGFGRIKLPDSKLTWRDLNEIFAACDDRGDGQVTIEDFIEFTKRTPSNIITLSLKL